MGLRISSAQLRYLREWATEKDMEGVCTSIICMVIDRVGLRLQNWGLLLGAGVSYEELSRAEILINYFSKFNVAL